MGLTFAWWTYCFFLQLSNRSNWQFVADCSEAAEKQVDINESTRLTNCFVRLVDDTLLPLLQPLVSAGESAACS